MLSVKWNENHLKNQSSKYKNNYFLKDWKLSIKYDTNILINAFSHLTDHHIKVVVQCHHLVLILSTHLISL